MDGSQIDQADSHRVAASELRQFIERQALRASLLGRIERQQGRAGITRLRQRLYHVTHEILARGGQV